MGGGLAGVTQEAKLLSLNFLSVATVYSPEVPVKILSNSWKQHRYIDVNITGT